MELSINAIITLVIALTFLAFGLGLVNDVLSFGGSILAKSIDGYSIDIFASSSDVLVISNPLVLESGNSNVILTSFYNKKFPRCDSKYSFLTGSWLYIDCPDLNIKRMQTITLDIGMGRSDTLAISLDLARGTKSGQYLCYAKVFCNTRGDIAPYDGLINEGDSSVNNALVHSEPIFVRVE